MPALLTVKHHVLAMFQTTQARANLIVEVRRRTRPMVCFVNVHSLDRIIYSRFHRFSLEWKTRALRVFTEAA